MNLNDGAPNAQQSRVPLKFVIEGKEFETFDQYKTGAELKQLAGIPLDYRVIFVYQQAIQR